MWLERLQFKSSQHVGSKAKAMRSRTVCVCVADLLCTCKVVGFPGMRAVPKLESTQCQELLYISSDYPVKLLCHLNF